MPNEDQGCHLEHHWSYKLPERKVVGGSWSLATNNWLGILSARAEPTVHVFMCHQVRTLNLLREVGNINLGADGSNWRAQR